FSLREKVGSRFAPLRIALSGAKELTVNSATRMRGLDRNLPRLRAACHVQDWQPKAVDAQNDRRRLLRSKFEFIHTFFDSPGWHLL
ncbi:MAG: hypothetical protein ACRD2B_02240, partial [Terriglobia bacterium]